MHIHKIRPNELYTLSLKTSFKIIHFYICRLFCQHNCQKGLYTTRHLNVVGFGVNSQFAFLIECEKNCHEIYIFNTHFYTYCRKLFSLPRFDGKLQKMKKCTIFVAGFPL